MFVHSSYRVNTHPTLFTSLHYHIHNTEVDKQRKVFKDLTNRQEKFAADLKTKLDDNERVVSSKEEEISSTRAELDLIEQQISLHKASTAEKMTNELAEIESARQHCQEMVDNAESELKATRAMHDFSSSQDERRAIRKASVCYLSSEEEDDSDIDSQAGEDEEEIRGDWPVVPDPRIPDDWKEIDDGYFHPVHGPIHRSYILHFLAQLELEKVSLFDM